MCKRNAHQNVKNAYVNIKRAIITALCIAVRDRMHSDIYTAYTATHCNSQKSALHLVIVCLVARSLQHTATHCNTEIECIQKYIQPIAFGVSFNLNLQSQSHWSLFNGTRQKRPEESSIEI